LWNDTPQKSAARYYGPRTRSIIETYLASHPLKKLHIGAQANVLPDWLNVDIYTGAGADIAYLDATQRFPLPDNTFDYVFSEHMIEHVSLQDAKFMLTECHRVLKNNGKIRIATPGLDKLWSLSNTDEDVQRYFREIVKPFYTKQGMDVPFRPEYMLNYIMYNFGHQFVYSVKSLTDLMNGCGFKVTGSYEPHKSDDAHFRDIEKHGVNSHPLCDLETMNVEAVK